MDYHLLKYDELDEGAQQAVQKYVDTKKKLDEFKASAKDIKSNEKSYKSKIQNALRKQCKHDTVIVPYNKCKIKMELVKGKPKPVNKKYIQAFLQKRLKGMNVDSKQLVQDMFNPKNRGRKEDNYHLFIEDPE